MSSPATRRHSSWSRPRKDFRSLGRAPSRYRSTLWPSKPIRSPLSVRLIRSARSARAITSPLAGSARTTVKKGARSRARPNLNLLRRLAESGNGKILDPAIPALNPFSHDRQKTFQPRDLWETLLKFAIVLFTLDVAVRRIQIDRDEWRRALQILRRWLFFWEGAPRPAEAEVSLAALLARREQVRSTHTAPALEPNPDLFRPQRPVTEPSPATEPGPAPATVASPA